MADKSTELKSFGITQEPNNDDEYDYEAAFDAKQLRVASCSSSFHPSNISTAGGFNGGRSVEAQSGLEPLSSTNSQPNNNKTDESRCSCNCCTDRGTPLPLWPVALANLGICALLLGYLLIGSFVFLRIEGIDEVAAVAEQLGVGGLNASPVFDKKLTSAHRESSASWQLAQGAHYQHGAESTQSLVGRTTVQGLGVAAPAVALSSAVADSHGKQSVRTVNHSVGRSRRQDGTAAARVTISAVASHRRAVAGPEAETRHVNMLETGVNAVDSQVSSSESSADLELGAGMAVAEALQLDAGEEMGGRFSIEDADQRRIVENIWDITVSLNILYKENWTRLIGLEIDRYQNQLVRRFLSDLHAPATATASMTPATSTTTKTSFNMAKITSTLRMRAAEAAHNAHLQRIKEQLDHFRWNFGTAFLFCLTVITTVGYGTIVPQTTLGRMFTIGYATIGIPLMLIYLSTAGSILAKLICALCDRTFCCLWCCCRQRPGQLLGRGQWQSSYGFGTQNGCASASMAAGQEADNKQSIATAHAHAHAHVHTHVHAHAHAHAHAHGHGNSNESSNTANTNPMPIPVTMPVPVPVPVTLPVPVPVQVPLPVPLQKLKQLQPPVQEHLLYCYVRPPADEMAHTDMEMASGKHQANQPRHQHSQSQQQHEIGGLVTAKQLGTRQRHLLSCTLLAPAFCCLIFLLVYLLVGAVCIAMLENWSLVDGVYFCFMSLTTIGFCDLLPGIRSSGHAGTDDTAVLSSPELSVWFCAAYIMCGLTFTSVCINLLREEILRRMRVVVKLKKVAARDTNASDYHRVVTTPG